MSYCELPLLAMALRAAGYVRARDAVDDESTDPWRKIEPESSAEALLIESVGTPTHEYAIDGFLAPRDAAGYWLSEDDAWIAPPADGGATTSMLGARRMLELRVERDGNERYARIMATLSAQHQREAGRSRKSHRFTRRRRRQ
jgi:hypothetical protein